MSTPGIGRGISTRNVRKIEAPRPLKNISNETKKPSSLALPAKAIDTPEKLILLMNVVVDGILSDDELSLRPENKALLTSSIISLCENLKIFGPQLENSMYQGQLDRAFLAFRDGMVRNNLEFEARVHLLEILELRECHWMPRKENLLMKNTPEEDFNHAFVQQFSPSIQSQTTHLGVDEVVKSSGKYREKPGRPSSKNYCKEEIIIRNADSGKVMGIKGRRVHMIEQLSETIISFQKVQPAFKERLVQITGPNEDKIAYATQLIEETIRNNSSPIRELNGSEYSYSSDDSSQNHGEDRKDSFSNWNCESYQYKHKVSFNDFHLTITGNNYDYVTLAKEVLDDYFSKLGKSENGIYFSENPPIYKDFSFMSADAMTSPKNSFTYYGSNIIDSNEVIDELQDDALLKQLCDELKNVNVDKTEELPLSDKEDSDIIKIVYTKEFLVSCRQNELSKKEPENWQEIKNRFPSLIKEDLNSNSTNASENIVEIL